MAFLSRDPDRKALAEIQALATRRDGLVARLADATARADAALAEQHRLLTESDTPDADAVRRAGDLCRRTADDRAAVEAAARDIAQQIADAQAGLDAQRDRRARDAAAREQEAGAERIEAAATRLDDAAREFAAARKHVLDTCRTDAPKYGFVSAESPGWILVQNAARLADILPRELSIVQQHDTYGHKVPFGVGASLGAAHVASDLRAKATAIRTGLVEVATPKPLESGSPP